MSYSFHVELDAPPRYEEVLGVTAVELDTAEGLADDLPPGPWAEGHVLAVWQHETSTRPIELSWEDGAFGVRILACSCPEDYELGLELVCEVARAADAEIESEDSVRFAPDDRAEHYGPAWIEDHIRANVAVAVMQAEEAAADGGVLQLPGPTASFHFGQRVLDAIDDADADDAHEALFTQMRSLFYFDDERYYRANAMVAKFEDGREIILTALAPGVAYVFPPVEYLAVLAEPSFEIRRADLPELLGDSSVTWLDDSHMQIDALEGAEWQAFVERARAKAVQTGLPPRDAPAARGSQGSRPLPWTTIGLGLLLVGLLLWFLSR